jgi:uncharacterized protein YndB with AHSA1/START domain
VLRAERLEYELGSLETQRDVEVGRNELSHAPNRRTSTRGERGKPMSCEPSGGPTFDTERVTPCFGGLFWRPWRAVERSQMKNIANGSVRILGSLALADGFGVVRIEERFDVDIDEVWSALTEPERLVRWYGEVEGELRLGGAYRAHLHASGWEGTGRIEQCESPRRFVVASKQRDEANERSTEVTLAAHDGDQTLLVVEQRRLPLDLLWAYGAGLQIHVEDLAEHIAGRERVDAKSRFDELAPPYTDMAATVS